jgi:hypothetical protein
VILILDTNAMWSNPELQGDRWGAVRRAVAEQVLTVIVPRIVVAELTGRTRTERRKSRPSNRPDHNAPDSVKEAHQSVIDQVEMWAQSYDADIAIRGAGFTIAPTPAVDHDELAQRAIDRVAPFDEDGGGYRDAIHWHSVLEQVRAHPDKQIVFMSNDSGFRSSRKSSGFDQQLADEAAEILTTGTLTLVETLGEFDVPGKYAADAVKSSITDDLLDELLAELFTDGTLRTSDLWEALGGRAEALDADLSHPTSAKVMSATTRTLSDGGEELHARLRLTADVLFDWDYPDEASEQPLEITARFTLDSDGKLLQDTAEDITVRPFLVVPDTTPTEPIVRPARTSRSATGWAFDNWLSHEIARGIAIPMVGALSGVREINAAQMAGITAGLFASSAVISKMTRTYAAEAVRASVPNPVALTRPSPFIGFTGLGAVPGVRGPSGANKGRHSQPTSSESDEPTPDDSATTPKEPVSPSE